VLVLISIVLLVVYVHHIGQSLRVASLIELVGDDTRKLVDEIYPDRRTAARAPDDRVVTATRSGVVSHIDHGALVDAARRAGCTLHMVVALGEFVPAGAPLFSVDGDVGALEHDDVRGAVVVSLERTLEQDVAYGLRLLVDIAERSLSESPFVDPTTAVQAVDRLYDCLRQLATREFPDGAHRDAEGQVRLVVPTMDWDAYVHLAFDEIRIAGAGSPQVSRRLHAALGDLKEVVTADRVPVLQDQIDLLTGLTNDVMTDDRDASMASQSDSQGIGVAAGTAAL
jgi:uncharacterized membrane protein